MSFTPKCMATAIGSVPHTDVDAACKLVLDNLIDIPMWPQFPNVSYNESIYVQYSERMPGLVVDTHERKVRFDTTGDVIGELEQVFEHYMSDDVEYFAIGRDHAQGFYRFIELLKENPYPDIKALKGHVIGPYTIGFTVADQNKRPAFYDDALREGIVKTLAMKAKWQVKRFKEVRPDLPALIFIDDPYLTSIGSGYVSMDRDEAVAHLNEIIHAVDGLTGIHCCANTDWGLLTHTDVDIISFDAYDYSEIVALYPEEMSAFLERGGILAWGIVPSGLPTPDQVARETAESLIERLEGGMQLLVDKGIDKGLIMRQALVTPSCGTGTMQPELAEHSFSLAREVSDTLRRTYFG